MKPSTVIVDDDRLIIEGLRRSIGREVDILATGSDAQSAIDLTWEHWPHVLLLDIHMRGDCPFSACEKITEETDTTVLFFSGTERDESINRAAAAGARGLARKGVDTGDDLVSAIKHVANGGSFWPNNISPLQHHLESHESHFLSEQELNCLRMLARGQSVPQIAAKFEISARSANRILKRLQVKLSAKTRFELIAIAMRFGIIDPMV